jgi:rhodanese-related sulfurtransferase
MLKKGVRAMVAQAMAEVETLTVEEAKLIHGRDDVVFVDLRDGLERQQGGYVPGSVHASRGMFEFHLDPESPAHMPALSSGKRLVLYCGSGGRSSLTAKTAQDMGLTNICHIGGGFAAWTGTGGPVERG